MINPALDIFKRDGFGAHEWLEAARDLEAAQRRIIDLSANSPGKYVVVSRASGQMVGGGTTITSGGARAGERQAEERAKDAAGRRNHAEESANHAGEVASSSRKSSTPSDAESETLWR